MSSCIKLQYRRRQSAGHGTHWIVKVPDADIYASCSLVGLGVVYKHSLKPIVEADKPVLAVVLLRLLDGPRVHVVRRAAARARPVRWLGREHPVR